MQLAPVVYSFGARCPRGHLPAQQLSASELDRAHLEFYCVLCDLGWSPSPDERERVRALVEASGPNRPPVAATDVVVVRLTCEQCAAGVDIHCQPHGTNDGSATSLIECPDCGHPTDAILPGPILDIFRS